MQDPVLFSGSLRSNMDPEGSWPDHKLWEALAAVQLKEAVVKVSCQLIRNSLQECGHTLTRDTVEHVRVRWRIQGCDANGYTVICHTRHHLPCP